MEDNRPVPKPRRIVQDVTNSQYENVTVDVINKNVNIFNENIQKNASYKISDDKSGFISELISNDELNNIKKSISTKMQSDKDEMDSNRPIPAPRRLNSNSSPTAVYENTNITPLPTVEITNKLNSSLQTRRAPDVPKKINNNLHTRRIYPNEASEQTTPSQKDDRHSKLQKSVSNSTIDSSISSTSSNDNCKYKNPSPSDLLKSLGTTSRLLTEAITERVAVKAKGAKNKLDKNLKSSQDKISNWGAETTSRLKSVRKRINSLTGQTLSLSRSEKKTTTNVEPEHTRTLPLNDKLLNITFKSPLAKAQNLEDLSVVDHSYEVPKNVKNANRYSFDTNDCPTYEEAISSGSFSYLDPDRISNAEETSSSFQRNTKTTQSLTGTKLETPVLPNRIKENRNKSDPNMNNLNATTKIYSSQSNYSPLQKSQTEVLSSIIKPADLDNDNRSSTSSDECLPMPNYPAPVLKDETPYGKIRIPVLPPVRPKRKKNYENLEIKLNVEEPKSNRATIDPAELRENLDLPSRDVSIEIAEQIKVQENQIPSPSRSESWTYHDGNESSSPEPIYANDESVYGQMCEMESSIENTLLAPGPATGTLVDIPPTPSFLSTLVEPPAPREIIYEFDPLAGRKLENGVVEKSNELILLESLLQEETYGTLQRDASLLDDQSLDSSDDDNSTVATNTEKTDNSIPPPPKRSDSLDCPSNQVNTSDMQIIHQNRHLRSDSLEALDEAAVEPYLARVDEEANEATSLSVSQTNWFVNEEPQSETPKTQRKNPFNRKPQSPSPVTKLSEKFKDKPKQIHDPPSYTEAMASTSNTVKFTESKIVSIPSETQGTKSSMKSMFSNVFNKMENLKRKTSFRVTRPSDVRVIIEMIPKPTLSQRMILHEGYLIRLPSNSVEDILKEMQNRKAMLRERKFMTFLDKAQKETFPLEHITTIQCVNNHKFSSNSTQLYCFEITTTVAKNQSSQQSLSNPNVVVTNTNSGNKKLQRVCHHYGVIRESERDIWMQKLLESLTSVFPKSYTCQYFRAGWCYLKSSITSPWSGTWMLLQKRKRRLIFRSDAEMNTEKVDLRKARCIVLKESDESIKNLHVESGPILMIDCPPYTIYLIMSMPRETKIWRHLIREVAHNNGPSLSEQQLTKNNVPVIIDKCINFIYIHGSMSEGIYRKSGSENSIQKLVTQFRTDAFNVEITRNDYNEHDVANVLKRFMRDLPQRLLGKHSVSFISITDLNSIEDKISAYKELMQRLSDIEFQTLKKIIGHLAFIQSQKSKNKMGIDNLSMIWGPTLLQDKTLDEVAYSQKEADVIADLITLYKHLYQLSPDEIIKEQQILLHLQKYYAAAENLSDAVKKSGDLKVWITINRSPGFKKEEKQINVTLTPTKTVYDVCKELAPKIGMAAHEVTLNEVILDGTLERPLHHTAKTFDVVLRWSYWPEVDRKNNYLFLKPITVLYEVQRALKNLAIVMPSKELKFADNKTKSFKSYNVELINNKISVLKKDKSLPVIVKDIPLDSVTAYVGCEKKRDSQLRWAITLVENNSTKVLRSKDLPFIGHVIGGTEFEDQIIWFSGIWHSMYREDVLPPAEIVIT